MKEPPNLFILVTGAGVSPRASELINGSVAAGWQTYTVGTPNLAMVTDPAALLDRPGVTWVRDYKYPPLDIFPFGTMLVAPCTFNTFNKLAHGIGDTLVTAMVNDALGAGLPVFIAPSFNTGLWNHPQTRISTNRLREWGCEIIEPQISPGRVVMAEPEVILARLREHFQTT